MQKGGLHAGGEFALPLATGEGGWQGAWGSLLSWKEFMGRVCLTGKKGQ